MGFPQPYPRDIERGLSISHPLTLFGVAVQDTETHWKAAKKAVCNIWNNGAERDTAVSNLEHSYEFMKARIFPQNQHQRPVAQHGSLMPLGINLSK